MSSVFPSSLLLPSLYDLVVWPWLSLIFNMAYSIVGMFDKDLELKRPTLADTDLLFAVGEPFQSVKTQIGLTTGVLNGQRNLTIESLMPDNGVIFSDGIESDFLKFNSGAIARIGLAEETARLVIQR